MQRFRAESAKTKLADAIKHGRTGEAALFADTVVPQNADAQLLILSAMAYFSADRFIDADEFLRRAKRLDDAYPAAHEFEAFIKLKSASTRDEAAVAYLALSDKVPSRQYRKILKKIRTSDDFSKYQKSAKLAAFVKPGTPVSARTRYFRLPVPAFPFKKFLFAIPFILAAAAVGAGVYKGINSGTLKVMPETVQDSFYAETVDIDSKYPLIDKVSNEKKKYFYIDEDQVKKEFYSAKILLKDKKYNESRIVINRILSSNANISVKEKAEFLIKFIPNPSVITPMDILPKELLSQRELYDGVVISCTGTAANVEKKDGKTMLTLLLNYQEKTRFDGVIEVFYNGESNVLDGSKVKVQGMLLHQTAAIDKPYMQAVKVVVEKKFE